jgi:polysaccharide export outer membrane protein
MGRRLLPVLAVVEAFVIVGCTTPDFQQAGLNPTPQKPEPIFLREGDVIRISFPGAPSLNTPAQQIRRDGKITLPLVGEFTAAGKTPGELENELIQLYSGQLVIKEVNVSVESSLFWVYVTGAVLKPGRVEANRPMTALEAVMEAGGFDYGKANLRGVTVTRTTHGHVEHYLLNLKRVLEGKDAEPFYLKASDIIYVPEKFTWF